MRNKKSYLYHYVYEIIEISTDLKYIGVRSCNRKPEDDLGKRYFSSSTNKEFVKAQKIDPSKYRYAILSVYDNREEAANEEIRLHKLYNVAKSDCFYNPKLT